MRIAWLGLALAVATGCSGLVDDGGNGGRSAAEITARRLWLNKALPVLYANCIECHADGGTGTVSAPTFLAGADDFGIRDTLMAHDPPVISLDAPATSYLLTRGAHDGPVLTGTEASDLLDWITAEKAAGSETEPEVVIQVAKFPPSICTSGLPDDPAAPNPNCLINKIALDEVGGVGAQIEFVLMAITGGASYMTNMKLVPGAAGVYMEHPLFVSWPVAAVDGRAECRPDANGETFCTDILDRFASMKMNLMTGAAVADQQIASGAATFPDFLATDMMSIRFKLVDKYQP